MKKIAFALGITVLLAGCLKKNDGLQFQCNYDPCAFKAPDAEVQAVQQYLTDNNIEATKHCSGLFYKIVEPGTGKTPQACSGVLARYTGKLTNGTVFDSTGSNAAGFYLNRVITGWTNGVPLIKEGGKINLYIPPSLAYGSRGQGSIPPNSILVFEVKLDYVQ